MFRATVVLSSHLLALCFWIAVYAKILGLMWFIYLFLTAVPLVATGKKSALCHITCPISFFHFFFIRATWNDFLEEIVPYLGCCFVCCINCIAHPFIFNRVCSFIQKWKMLLPHHCVTVWNTFLLSEYFNNQTKSQEGVLWWPRNGRNSIKNIHLFRVTSAEGEVWLKKKIKIPTC